jgi:hypothetical protein
MEYIVWLGLAAGALVLSLAAMKRSIPPKAGAAASAMTWGVVAIGATDLEKTTQCCVTQSSNIPAAILAGAFGGYMLLFLFNSIFEMFGEDTPDGSAGERNRQRATDAMRGGER